MTDNEKRAHDLALTYLTKVAISTEEFYSMYFNAYQRFLAEVKQNFPK